MEMCQKQQYKQLLWEQVTLESQNQNPCCSTDRNWKWTISFVVPIHMHIIMTTSL